MSDEAVEQQEEVETPKQVTDEVEALAVVGDDPLDLDTFIDRLQEFKTKHATSTYNRFQVVGVSKKGEGVFLIQGERDEIAEEKAEREARESAERQRVEQAELKEYLRLRKKYGKKSEATE